MAFRGDSTDTYTYASGSTGGTVDLGARNNYRYVNADNVYAKGKADGTGTLTYSFINAQSYTATKNCFAVVVKANGASTGQAENGATLTISTTGAWKNYYRSVLGGISSSKSASTSVTYYSLQAGVVFGCAYLTSGQKISCSGSGSVYGIFVISL